MAITSPHTSGNRGHWKFRGGRGDGGGRAVTVPGPGSIVVRAFKGSVVMPTSAAEMWTVYDDMIAGEGAHAAAVFHSDSSPDTEKNMFQIIRPVVLGVAFSLALPTLSIAGAAEFSIEREDLGDIAVQIDGKLFTRYVTTDTVTNKCYFWEI